MKTISFSQAQRNYDHMEEPENPRIRRLEWANDMITDALCSDGYKAMLDFLGLPESEYREDWGSDYQAVADKYEDKYLAMVNRINSEY